MKSQNNQLGNCLECGTKLDIMYEITQYEKKAVIHCEKCGGLGYVEPE